jgi:hypothetical protein
MIARSSARLVAPMVPRTLCDPWRTCTIGQPATTCSFVTSVPSSATANAVPVEFAAAGVAAHASNRAAATLSIRAWRARKTWKRASRMSPWPFRFWRRRQRGACSPRRSDVRFAATCGAKLLGFAGGDFVMAQGHFHGLAHV